VRYAGGGGACSTANDYIKLLAAVLKSAMAREAFDNQLIKPETARQMFSPQLGTGSQKQLVEMCSHPLGFGLAGNLVECTKELQFGLGGILNLEDVSSTGRREGAMQWGGLPNLFWWVSPKDGICGCYFGQLMPEGDRRSFKMYELFEKAVLEDLKNPKAARL